MIATAITAIGPAIIGLGIVERYGGLAIPVTMTEVIDRDNSGNPRTIRKTFPVREGVDSDSCFQKSKYGDLVPSDQYKNLVYWEEISGMARYSGKVDYGKKNLHFRGSAQLVYWLNLPEMGHRNDDYRTVGDLYAWTLINGIEGRYSIGAGNFKGTTVMFNNPRQQRRDVELFSKYSYDLNDVHKYALYPYDFGAVQFDIEMILPKSCIQDYIATGPPIKCITEW